MTDIPRAVAIRGRTLRWHWTDGPTKCKTQEHVFHEDGTVTWREIEEPSTAARRRGTDAPAPTPERVPYAAFEVTPDVYAVSYPVPSGFTLTVVLNLANRTMVGFASGVIQWHPVRGRFEFAS
jgi:hypothetical protein